MSYDSKSDAAYIYIIPPGPGRSVARSSVAQIRMDRASITVDFTSDDQIAGIEILGVSRVVPVELLGGGASAVPE